MKKIFEPKLITVFQEGYSLALFWKDLTAGIIIGILAFPMSIAFAVASDVRPEQGLITAIIAGFLISALGGSRVQIGGPTGAFIVIILGVVHVYGYEGLALATLLAGGILVVMGLVRLGDVIKFIPYPVTVGFTSGIALIIFTSQIRYFFGFDITPPEQFIDQWCLYFSQVANINPWSVILGMMTIAIMTFWPKSKLFIPASLVAIVVTTLAVMIFHLPVATIGSRFGEIGHQLEPLRVPRASWDMIKQIFPSALTIALLAGIESLLSAVVADGMTGRRHRSNTELIAQGVANIASSLFGGIPATGAIARTATNIKLGGKTPIAGIIHAFTLLLVFFFFAPLVKLIPMASLSGILIVISYHMSEWRLFAKLFRSPKSDILVLLTTFLLTVFVNLTTAIEVGIIMAAFLFMRRMIEVTQISSLTDDEDSQDQAASYKNIVPSGVEIYEIYGPFFFGAADKFRETMRGLEKSPDVLILRMRHVPAMDATGLRALEDVFDKCSRDHVIIILAGVQSQPLELLKANGLTEKIGVKNICGSIEEAIERSRELQSGG